MRSQSSGPSPPTPCRAASRSMPPRRGRALPRAELGIAARRRSAVRLSQHSDVVPAVRRRDDRLVASIPSTSVGVARPRRPASPSGRRRRGRGSSRRASRSGCVVGLRLRLGRPHHEVADAEHLQVLHAAVEVVGRACRTRGRAPGSTGARASSLDGEEVERRRRRRLEVEAFHRADAAVGEVRQQLERERRAVAVDRVGRPSTTAPTARGRGGSVVHRRP